MKKSKSYWKRRFVKKTKSYWKKFEELHSYLLAAGAVIDRIHLKPRSYKNLSKEILPNGKLRGAVTYYGWVNIIEDKNGVSL